MEEVFLDIARGRRRAGGRRGRVTRRAAFSSLRRMWGLMYRHLALYRRSWPRLLELAYWPVLQMCIWGFTASFLAARAGSGIAMAGGLLLGGVLLWEVALRSQMGVAVSFLEELWSRNLGHVFVSPLRPWELVAALLGISILRMLIGVLPAVLLAWLLYAFNLFAMGPIIVLFFVNLVIMGWWVAFGVVVAHPAARPRRGSLGLVAAVRAYAVLRRVLSGRGAAAWCCSRSRSPCLPRTSSRACARRCCKGDPLGPHLWAFA